MGSHPVYDRPMTSGERSARNLLQQRQEIADIRTTLVESIELLLAHGTLLNEAGFRKEAFDAFRMAEVHNNHIQVINNRLKPHEDKIKSVRLPPRKGFPIPQDPRKPLLFAKPEEAKERARPMTEAEEAESLEQLAYKARRAARRPEIDARYGHLAKAEKESAE